MIVCIDCEDDGGPFIARALIPGGAPVYVCEDCDERNGWRTHSFPATPIAAGIPESGAGQGSANADHVVTRSALDGQSGGES